MTSEDRQPRYEVAWRARLRCREWHLAYRVVTANVSGGGAFLAAARCPPVGARVEVALELPDATVLTLTGECVHVRTPEQTRAQGRPPGFGLCFDRAPAGDLIKLVALAEAAGVPVEVCDGNRDEEVAAPLAASAALPEAPAVSLRAPRRRGAAGDDVPRRLLRVLRDRAPFFEEHGLWRQRGPDPRGAPDPWRRRPRSSRPLVRSSRKGRWFACAVQGSWPICRWLDGSLIRPARLG
jgi:hypothetical protein